jgi:hypothetical protein
MSTQSTDITAHAPPLYGEHILDQLYADIDQSGILTPAPQSGMNTPFSNMSRNGSSENLASLNGAVHPNGAVAPSALESRLHNLNLNSGSRNSTFLRSHPRVASGSNTPVSHPQTDAPGYFENHPNPASNPLSRRTSEEENPMSNLASGTHTPEHIDYSDLGDLTKVPSYSTAVKAPARGISYCDAVPNYEAAVSQPPSPARTFSSPTSPGLDSPTGGNSIHAASSARRSNNRLIQHPAPVHIANGDADERRRLHFLRHRESAH